MASALGIGSAGKRKGLALRCRHCSGTEDQRNAAATRGHKAEIFQVRGTCQNLLALFSPYCMNVYFFCFFFFPFGCLNIPFPPAFSTKVFCSASCSGAEQPSATLPFYPSRVFQNAQHQHRNAAVDQLSSVTPETAKTKNSHRIQQAETFSKKI